MMPPDLSRYDAVLIDLDGTIYHEHGNEVRLLAPSAAFVSRLKTAGRTYAYLTNSGASPRQIERKLTGLIDGIAAGQIWSCAAASGEYVKHTWGAKGRVARVFNCSTEGVHDSLDGDVHWTADHNDACDVVVAAGPGSRFSTPERQWQALQLLRKGAALVGMCADRVWPSQRGFEFGAGAGTMLLSYASAVTPTFCGKPEAVFFQELCDRLKVRADRCVIIGDNLESDIAGAKNAGAASILVLSGVSTRADAAKLPIERQPDYIIDSLDALR